MSEEIIKYGINVRECPHINAYNPNKPICQRGVGIGGSPSECNGNCDYVRNADIERKIKNLSELVSWQREKFEEIRAIVSDTCRKRCTNECLGIKKHCGYGKILNKINEVLDER